ncbi:MAG TPA: exodeoxyribonuclease VII large subunit [Acidobacteriaceae bacterium]
MAHSYSDNDESRGESRDQLGLLFPPERHPESRRIWTVSALVTEIRGHVERAYPDCWVEGEISNLRSAASGHVYFTLKDEQGQLPVVLFRRQASLLRFRPEAGLHVLLRGRISLYEERGQLQLVAETLEPVGAGSLQFAFEQLKKKLQQEGLFDASRKQALPPFPRCIGIITSPSGAVIRDFLNIVGRRHAGLDVMLYPASVQGEQAAGEIASGILHFNQAKSVDAIVIARGGGSAEDLAAFNTETLARAIGGSAIPIVSAVGHETDFTIADFVADLRAPTPSAAAELLTSMQHGVEERVEALQLRLLRACRYNIALAERRFAAVSPEAVRAPVRRRLDRAQQRVDEQQFRLAASWQTLLRARAATVQDLYGRLLRQSRFQTLVLRRERCAQATQQLHHAFQARQLTAHRAAESLAGRLLLQSPSHRCYRLRQTIAHLESRSRRAVSTNIERARSARSALDGRLAALSPLAVLDRGYSLTFSSAGQLVRASSVVAEGELLKTRFARGSVTSRVVHTEDGI